MASGDRVIMVGLPSMVMLIFIFSPFFSKNSSFNLSIQPIATLRLISALTQEYGKSNALSNRRT